MSATPAPAGPVVTSTTVTFRLPDPHHRLAGVRLWQEVRVPGDRLDFTRRRGTWTLRLDRPDVDRMEYLLELVHFNGGRETIPDPGNPTRVSGAFGDKSVVAFPEYAPPRWLAAAPTSAYVREIALPSRNLAATVHGYLWSPDQLPADEPAPLLIVHDGPEYDSLASMTHYLGATVALGALPPLRAALLAPGDRNRWYAVNPAYARALCDEVVPVLVEQAPAIARIGAGASLGAVALLHAHRRHPGVFDGLFLQSGSFFHPDFDAHERRFSRYGPIVRFVAELSHAIADAHPVPTVLTCGGIEENMDNNRLMTATLHGLGYPVELHEVRDVHNYTAWRDALDPHLTGLLARAALPLPPLLQT
jgi:enterochelin esterase-like enzyme